MAEELVPVYIMGKRYDVPPGLTIMKAMEYAGYRLVRGVGCRAGFCGACATVYRLAGDYRLRVGLACQTVVEPGMYLAQIPFYPAPRAQYDITKLQPTFATLVSLYPELLRCLGCGTCTKVCPQELDVKDIMARAMRGDIAGVADKSFDCIMCGMCVSRCPAEEAQYNIFILARRLYGRYIAPRAQHLAKRVQEIEAGLYDQDIQRLKSLSNAELRQLYNSRDIEPE
ncbi:MAG: 4Fe-4S dicluster domain-containing protein [Anaerolineae bacterium]|jgi:ferredoxin|nr:4Fe-4S dicluster domain-containing protein [Anaerolineae bacterium]